MTTSVLGAAERVSARAAPNNAWIVATASAAAKQTLAHRFVTPTRATSSVAVEATTATTPMPAPTATCAIVSVAALVTGSGSRLAAMWTESETMIQSPMTQTRALLRREGASSQHDVYLPRSRAGA
jgi:hypothetical protein